MIDALDKVKLKNSGCWDSWYGWDGWNCWDSWDQQIHRKLVAQSGFKKNSLF